MTPEPREMALEIREPGCVGGTVVMRHGWFCPTGFEPGDGAALVRVGGQIVADLLPAGSKVTVQLQSIRSGTVVRVTTEQSVDLFTVSSRGDVSHLFGPVSTGRYAWVHVDRSASCVGYTRLTEHPPNTCELRSISTGDLLLSAPCGPFGGVAAIDCAHRTLLLRETTGQSRVSPDGVVAVALPEQWGLLSRVVGDCIAVGQREGLTVRCGERERQLEWPFRVNEASDIALSERTGDVVWVAMTDRQDPHLWLAEVDTSGVSPIQWHGAALGQPSSVYSPVVHHGQVCVAIEPVVEEYAPEPPRRMVCTSVPRR